MSAKTRNKKNVIRHQIEKYYDNGPIILVIALNPEIIFPVEIEKPVDRNRQI